MKFKSLIIGIMLIGVLLLSGCGTNIIEKEDMINCVEGHYKPTEKMSENANDMNLDIDYIRVLNVSGQDKCIVRVVLDEPTYDNFYNEINYIDIYNCYNVVKRNFEEYPNKVIEEGFYEGGRYNGNWIEPVYGNETFTIDEMFVRICQTS